MDWINIKDQKPDNKKVIIVTNYEDTQYCLGQFNSYSKWRCALCTDGPCYFDFWMYFPNQPERLSEKTPQGEAIVRSLEET